MAITNFVVTVLAVGAVVMLAKGDVKQSASVFRRNIKHIRTWLEEESVAASKSAEKVNPKELGSEALKKDGPKGNKD